MGILVEDKRMFRKKATIAESSKLKKVAQI
jgi:hypothetical protein